MIWMVVTALALATLYYMIRVPVPRSKRQFAILLALCAALAIVIGAALRGENSDIAAEAHEECETSGNSALAGLDMVKCAGARARRP